MTEFVLSPQGEKVIRSIDVEEEYHSLRIFLFSQGYGKDFENARESMCGGCIALGRRMCNGLIENGVATLQTNAIRTDTGKPQFEGYTRLGNAYETEEDLDMKMRVAEAAKCLENISPPQKPVERKQPKREGMIIPGGSWRSTR